MFEGGVGECSPILLEYSRAAALEPRLYNCAVDALPRPRVWSQGGSGTCIFSLDFLPEVLAGRTFPVIPRSEPLGGPAWLPRLPQKPLLRVGKAFYNLAPDEHWAGSQPQI